MKRIICTVAVVLLVAASVFAADDPLARLKDDTLQFFRPVSGKVVKADGQSILFEVYTKDPILPGTRVSIMSEGEPFRHPVTGEILGRIETQAGRAAVTGRSGDLIAATVVAGKAKEGDRVRISETKVKMVFVQDRHVDWYVGDDLYRKLKASGRVEMLDTALDDGNEQKVLDEAKRLNGEVVLLLTAKEADKGSLLREQLFWVADGSRFYDSEVKLDVAFTKDLRFGSELFTPLTGEAIFTYRIPYGARFVVTGDFDGDGKQEIAISEGRNVRTYLPAGDLQPLWETKGMATDDHIWLDAIDLNHNGRDELVAVSMRGSEVVSSIFELEGTEFRKIGEVKYFLRRVGTTLIGQMYSSSDGFRDDVFTVVWDGEYKRGEKMKLPRGITIYDFVDIEGPSKEHALLTYDEKGFLNVFDDRGIRVWRSSADTGGFVTSFKKSAPASYIEAGEWSIKDRLLKRGRDVLVVNRIPLVNMAKGLGYKSSLIKSYWWNGFSMEESTVVEDIPGSLQDYAIAGDKLVVLSTSVFGVNVQNLIKGENPLGTTLQIYSIKGR